MTDRLIRRLVGVSLVGLAAALLSPATALAGESPPSIPAPEAPDANGVDARNPLNAPVAPDLEPSVESLPPAQTIVYTPPRRGSPRARRGGGVRAASVGLPTPLTLAPQDHVGLTTQAQPSLFWYVDGTTPADTDVVFALIETGGIAPLLRRTISAPSRAGTSRVRLEELDVSLQLGVEYEWSISVVVDPEQPARDRVSVGAIQRVESVDEFESPIELARAGLWYDALEQLSNAAAEGSDSAIAMRRSLLDQAGLSRAADATLNE